MASKYVDTSAALQVIGNVFNKPNLLEQSDKYTITDIDFVEDLHLTIFGAIYNLFENGAKEINLNVIEDYLAQHPKTKAVYEKEKGAEWLSKVSESANESTFDYYYNRLKKFTLLREFDKIGMDIQWLYDPDNILDSKKRETQEYWLDNHTLAEIAQRITDKIDEVKATCVDNSFGEVLSPADGLEEYLDDLKQHPAFGLPLYGSLINTVCRGARLGCFYLRSAGSGYGKSRSMIADAGYLGCNQIYDENFGWLSTGEAQPTLYISVELSLQEVQTMLLAFISAVPEDHILDNRYVGDEEDRVRKAIQVLKESKLHIVELPDFSMADVENLIKRSIREYDVRYVVYDYLMSSLKILSEVAGKSGGVKLREDHILFILSRRLKDIATSYDVFILSGTQLSGDWRACETPDQSLLRGAKSIADSLDFGSIILPTTAEDLQNLETILGSGNFDQPNVKLSVYKNRRGRYKGVYLWIKADYGTCRFQPMFCTGWDYSYIPLEDIKIETKKPCAF